MKDLRCKALHNHISRIQGQLEALKKQIDNCESCDKVTLLAISIIKSLDSLRAKMVEGYVVEEIMDGKMPSPQRRAKLERLIKLIKC